MLPRQTGRMNRNWRSGPASSACHRGWGCKRERMIVAAVAVPAVAVVAASAVVGIVGDCNSAERCWLVVVGPEASRLAGCCPQA